MKYNIIALICTDFIDMYRQTDREREIEREISLFDVVVRRQ